MVVTASTPTQKSIAALILQAGGDVWADRFRGSETTAYLAAADGSNMLSWTNAAITATVDLTAPALRVASGTGYLKVGSTNVVTWSASVFQVTADLGAHLRGPRWL